jgi:DNA-binding MarR family transcriptional regulator
MNEGIPGPPYIHPALLRHTGFLISRMGHVAQRAFREQMSSIGLTPRLWAVLNVLSSEQAITQHALGTLVGMDPSTTVATIDELESRGLVERRRNPSDRRAHALHLTASGRKTLDRGRKIAQRAQEELLAPLTEDERTQLHELLLRLALASAQRN